MHIKLHRQCVNSVYLVVTSRLSNESSCDEHCTLEKMWVCLILVTMWCTVVSQYFECFFLKFSVCPETFLYLFLCKFLLFCRKSIHRWTQKFLIEKWIRDHLRSLWWYVEFVTVRRWHHSEERSCLRKMGKSDLVWDYGSPWWTVIATIVRPAGLT